MRAVCEIRRGQIRPKRHTRVGTGNETRGRDARQTRAALHSCGRILRAYASAAPLTGVGCVSGAHTDATTSGAGEKRGESGVDGGDRQSQQRDGKKRPFPRACASEASRQTTRENETYNKNTNGKCTELSISRSFYDAIVRPNARMGRMEAIFDFKAEEKSRCVFSPIARWCDSPDRGIIGIGVLTHPPHRSAELCGFADARRRQDSGLRPQRSDGCVCRSRSLCSRVRRVCLSSECPAQARARRSLPGVRSDEPDSGLTPRIAV